MARAISARLRPRCPRRCPTGRRSRPSAATTASPRRAQKLASACGCASACDVHGHDHAAALGASVPAADVQSFWGAFGCGCWAI